MLRMRQLRKEAGLTQMELSEKCGWPSQSRISGYESGDRKPNSNALKKIAKVLACTVDELLSDPEEKSAV